MARVLETHTSGYIRPIFGDCQSTSHSRYPPSRLSLPPGGQRKDRTYFKDHSSPQRPPGGFMLTLESILLPSRIRHDERTHERFTTAVAFFHREEEVLKRFSYKILVCVQYKGLMVPRNCNCSNLMYLYMLTLTPLAPHRLTP